jgi:CheY-like chemotaxis protein
LKAENGLQALEKIVENPKVEIVFTGLQMPEMDGWQLIEKLKSNPQTAKIKIVINSHRGSDEDKKRAESLGVDGFLIRSLTTPKTAISQVNSLFTEKSYVIDCENLNDKSLVEFLKDYFDGKTCLPSQKMVLKLKSVNSADKTFKIDFECVDKVG